MIKTVCTALALSSVVVLAALCSIKPANAESAGTYRDAVKQCGAEWKNSDARKAVQKGQGRQAWQDFRRDCVKRVGYVTKKGKAN